MIVVVISDKRVLTGWASRAAANKWLDGWLAESRDRWGWVVQSEIVSPATHPIYCIPFGDHK